MDVLMDLLITLAKALINQSVIFLFGKIPSEKSKKKTTHIKKTRQSGDGSRNKNNI